MFALVGGNGYVGTAFQKYLKASGLPFRTCPARISIITIAPD